MLLNAIGGSRVLFVGGKGGVGKTTVSSALALACADRGERVLLVSTDPAHNLTQLWQRQLGDDPVTVEVTAAPSTGGTAGGRVDAVEIDPQLTVDRHLDSVRETMRQLLPERLHAQADKHLALAREAPGSHEAAVLERIADAVELGLRAYDRVIFDTAPTGHTLRLLALPAQLSDWASALLQNRARSERFGAAMRGLVSTGDADSDPGQGSARDRAEAELRRTLHRRSERFELVRASFTDPAVTRFVLVTAPEPIPVRETIDLARSLAGLGVTACAVVVNRRSPADAGEFLARRRDNEAGHIATLTSELPDVPRGEIALSQHELVGTAALRAVADELAG